MEKLIYNLIRLVVCIVLVIYGINWVREKIDESAWERIKQSSKVEQTPQTPQTPQAQPNIIIQNGYDYEEKPASKGEWITEPCEYCKKTGYSLVDKEYTTHLYGERKKYWCDICKCYDYSHYHNLCPHCQGLGYTKRYVD